MDCPSHKSEVNSLLEKWRRSRRGPIAYWRQFANVAGGVVPGVFLAQLHYWSGKGWAPDGWIYKSAREWTVETGLTEAEQRTARKKLLAVGLMQIHTGGENNMRHYRLDYEALFRALEALEDAPSV